MTKLIKEVRESIKREYERASRKFGKTNTSDHQSYAVILEELQEAFEEGNKCSKALDKFWSNVKSKYSTGAEMHRDLIEIQTAATFAACEFIQVAAMAHKAELSITDKEGK